MAGGQGLFRDSFESKIDVYWSGQGALWHAGAWKPRYCVAGLKFASSGTLLRGFPRNCIAPAHFQTSNFGRP